MSLSRYKNWTPTLKELRQEARRVFGQSAVHVSERYGMWEARAYRFRHFSVKWTHEIRVRSVQRKGALRRLGEQLARMPSEGPLFNLGDRVKVGAHRDGSMDDFYGKRGRVVGITPPGGVEGDGLEVCVAFGAVRLFYAPSELTLVQP